MSHDRRLFEQPDHTPSDAAASDPVLRIRLLGGFRVSVGA